LNNKLLLEIELIPSTCFYSNVRTSVSKSQWDKIRKQVYSTANNTCQICNDSYNTLHAHEIWAYDDKKLIQILSGMICLCASCHSCKHFGFAQIQGKADEALKHLMLINKISKKQAEQHVADSFAIWKKRSEKQWKLDISLLAKFGVDLTKIKNAK
jgi:hypothetical protein